MMLTKWGEALDTEHVLEEYPRPQFRRDSYLNLNGIWEYAFTSSPEMPALWQGQILVPFSPECPLSGVNRTLLPGNFLWYRRNVVIPDDFNRGRVLLHFEAVDQIACVFIDGTPVYEHEGGYSPFTLDITDWIPQHGSMFQLHVRVQDFTDSFTYARGKQKLKHGGIWYTPQSGIWQSVWMESVPQSYIHSIRILPHAEENSVEFWVAGEGECILRIDGQPLHVFQAGQPAVFELEDCMLWTPDMPFLYDYRIEMGEDSADGYFALRSFEIKEDAGGNRKFYLNGAETFVNGVLDQGYWPDGLMTAPSDEALEFDIRSAKAMGFNTIRKHMKVEPQRWYYHCDQIGMMVWQDMPAGGEEFKWSVVTKPVVLGGSLKDSEYARFGRTDVEGRLQYLNELAGMVEELSSFACVCVWVPFNEGWGQFDSIRVEQFIRKLDPSRPIDRTSGWYDQGGGDMDSRHVYFKKIRYEGSGDRAGVISEFGGYVFRIEGHSQEEKTFGYKKFDSANSYKYALWSLYREEIMPARKMGLAGCIYTQLTDIEEEMNGLMTYDRKVYKLAPQLVKGITDPPKKAAKA